MWDIVALGAVTLRSLMENYDGEKYRNIHKFLEEAEGPLLIISLLVVSASLLVAIHQALEACKRWWKK